MSIAKNHFMNAVWSEATGKEITGVRLDGTPFHGLIESVRCTLGADIRMSIVDKDTGERFLEDASDVFEGERNLHIFF